MDLVVQIPDDIAVLFGANAGELSRRALEALVAEEYRSGRIHKPELRRLLGFETSYEIDGFLKGYGINERYTTEDLDRERQAFESLAL